MNPEHQSVGVVVAAKQKTEPITSIPWQKENIQAKVNQLHAM